MAACTRGSRHDESASRETCAAPPAARVDPRPLVRRLRCTCVCRKVDLAGTVSAVRSAISHFRNLKVSHTRLFPAEFLEKCIEGAMQRQRHRSRACATLPLDVRHRAMKYPRGPRGVDVRGAGRARGGIERADPTATVTGGRSAVLAARWEGQGRGVPFSDHFFLHLWGSAL